MSEQRAEGEMQDTIADSGPAARTLRSRPLWVRALALALIWTLVLQPAISSAQLSQQPLFTVTSVPPNVMLMLDDSASMNLLSLKPPAAMATQTFGFGTAGAPAMKLNTVGYYGVSGERYNFGNNAAYDGRWRHGLGDVLRRAPAFNPLAYNPAVTYFPWNNNGARLANASYGGNTDVATGLLTEWDKRSLPPNMGGGTVSSKLVGTQSGWIPSTGMPRSLTSTPAGTVNYERLTIGNTPEPPVGADLFTGTIAFRNPNCGGTVDTYAWQCPAGFNIVNPIDVCAAPGGYPSTNGQCCTSTTPFPDTRPATRYIEYAPNLYPPGSPPATPSAIFGNAGETCSTVTYWSQRFTTISPPTGCTDPPPYVAPCPGGGGELCTIDPPPTGCATEPRYTWRCDYTESFMNYTCNTTVAQQCNFTGTTCDGSSAPLTPTSVAVYDSGYWTPARYVTYEGPQPGTLAERQDLDNYRVIMIDRKFGWSGASRAVIPGVSRYDVIDAVSGLPGFRMDCVAGTWCTFPEEAQNYANWFTYYRSRLFAAVGVLSEVFSNFVGPEQYMRIGYGRLNHFPYALNPWDVGSITQGPSTVPNIDNQPSAGGVERGVRSFTVFNPPASIIPNLDRADVFNWLFTINGQGPTPSREALHASGLYFARNDPRGPWSLTPGVGAEPANQNLWCRRNYTVLATDGEWTRLPTTFGFTPQRLLENAGDFPTLAPLGSPSVSQSIAIDGPAITGSDRLTNLPLNYQYLFASEPQISGGSGTSQSETLSDVLLYYWSRDLRSDLRNSIVATPTNRAFWQHMAAYIVGYGVNATMDDPAASPSLRTNFNARNSINWPTVGLEPCRQFDDNVADAAIPNRPPCGYTVAPSGNRVNDELRGALSSGGDFFSANSPAALRAALDAVFAAIGAENASGTSPGLSSTTVSVGNLIVESNFRTNLWEGYVDAYDQLLLVNFLVSGGAKPAPLWSINFPTPPNRNIFTTTATATAAVDFLWPNLSLAQQTALDVTRIPFATSPVLDYLRGDQTLEIKNGGAFRSRLNTILGDVVNSSPLYSKAADFAYQLGAAGSHVLPVTSTQGYNTYRTHVTTKQTTRDEVVLFGANDGMLHVLDARVASGTSGQELFAFVPRGAYPNLRDLSQPAYLHKYYVDGPLVEGDVWNGTAWKTIAVGTTGAGRPGVFAIDITDPASGFSASNVLWDIVPSDDANPIIRDELGSVLHAGYIGSVKDSSVPNGKGRWAYIVGNGYESINNRATLLIFDAFNGTLIKAITTPPAFNLGPNGLGAITPVFDGARNVTAVYAGDKLGNLWKFDLSSSTINDPDGAGPLKGWEIFNKIAGSPVPLFQPTDEINYPLPGIAQPITAEPRITTHPISGLYVAFGTGKMFESTDPSITQTQAIYVLWDQNNILPLAKSQLQRIRMNEFLFDHDSNVATPDEVFRRFNAGDLALYDWNDKGFYIPLITAVQEGERVIAAPVLDGGVMAFTTFAPTTAGDQCIPGGASYLYRLNLADTLASSGFINVPASMGRRIQPGLVNSAPPIYVPQTPLVGTVDSMTAADVSTMLKNPKYKLSGGRAGNTGTTGTCAHVGLRVDGERVHIPTQCAGTMPLRVWRPVR